MIKHVASGPERFVAAFFVADEGSGILMNPAMDLEVLLLTETLATGGKLAQKGLSPVMQMRVRTQADPAQEGLVAAWEQTGEGGFGLTLRLTVNF